MAIGVALGKDVDPNVRKSIEQLNDYANGRNSSALMGKSFRWTEGPYPTPSSQVCALLQFKQGTNWKTIQAISPLGLDAMGCYALYENGTPQAFIAGVPAPINFSTKIFDTDNAVTIGPNWKFTVPPGKDGLYTVSGVVQPATAASTNTFVYLTIGTTLLLGNDLVQNPSVAANQTVSWSMTAPALSGQTITVSFNCTGGNTNLTPATNNNWISIYRNSLR